MTLPAIAAVILTSLLVVLMAARLFEGQPETRRLFIAMLAVLTLLVPLCCTLLDVRLTVGLVDVTLPVVADGAGELVLKGLLLSGGVAGLISFVGLSAARCRLERLPAATDPDLRTVADQLTEGLGLPLGIPIRIGAFGPASTTLGGRLVVLPPSVRRWSAETRRAVLAHELVHVARRDDLWIGVLRLMVIAFWWLPWLRTLPKLLERSVEESCDDRAAMLIGDDFHYLDGVWTVACERRQACPAGRGGLVGLIGAGSIHARFARFRSRRYPQVDSRGLYWAALGTAVLLVVIWSLHVVRVEPAASPLRIVALAERSTSEDLVLTLRARPPPALTIGAGPNRFARHTGAGPPG